MGEHLPKGDEDSTRRHARNDHTISLPSNIGAAVSDTGKALPDDTKVLKTTFSGLFTNGAESICEQEIVVKSTEMHESSIRVYKVTPGTKSSTNPAVSIARLPAVAKQSRLPFAGSEISFQLLSNVYAEDVINCVQAVLELSSMIAPRASLELRLKGFALEGNEGAEKARSVTLKYDIEPLPSDITAEQRFFEGLKAWFEEDDPAQQTSDYMESHEPSQPMNPDCSLHQMQLANSQFQLQQNQQPGMHPDDAGWQPEEPSCCDHMHEPDLVDDQPAWDALHRPQMMHDQQYEAPHHAVHPQCEQECQQQHSQQDDPLMGYVPGSVHPQPWNDAEDMQLTDQDGVTWQPHETDVCEEDEVQPERRPQLAVAIGQAGADAAKAGPGSKQAGVMLQRSKWTVQVGLVLHSQVPSPLAGYALPPGNAQVYLFQNYALLQRPPDNCLKALEKFSWQDFGLDVEVQALPSGAITLSFGAKSDPLSQKISALVLHLYNSEVKHEVSTGKAPALAAMTEAKMIKVALEDALMKLKDHFHGSLCNKVERRLQLCLPYLAKSLSKLVINSENADLQTHACQVMSCEIDYLQQELELRLQDAAAAELRTKLLPV
ncbi:hypothetical protein WJX79_009720 [Trebouxia sp. C0005]